MKHRVFLADGDPNVEVAPRALSVRPDGGSRLLCEAAVRRRRPCWRVRSRCNGEMLWNNARRGSFLMKAERLSAHVGGVVPIGQTLSGSM